MRDDVNDAIEAASAIQAACAGRSTVAVYMALGMVLGASEARAGKPNLPNLLRLIGETAQAEFDRTRAA